MITEILLPLALCISIDCIYKVLFAILTNKDVDVHLFFNTLDFDRKLEHEQNLIVLNIVYLCTIAISWVLYLFVNFETFFYNWVDLYVFSQVFTMLRYHNLPKYDKIAVALAPFVVFFFQTHLLRQLIAYSTLPFSAVVVLDKQMFPETRFISAKIEKQVNKFEAFSFVGFWISAFVQFFLHPNVGDIIFFPICFLLNLKQMGASIGSVAR